MINPYLEPVPRRWSRVAGWVLLLAAVALTAWLLVWLYSFATEAAARRSFNSSSLIFLLIEFTLCGMCWQAGYRLAFDRPDRSGTLFSWLAWLVIGVGLLVITGLMATVIVAARAPTAVDLEVVLFLGGLGAWCLVLAWRAKLRRSSQH